MFDGLFELWLDGGVLAGLCAHINRYSFKNNKVVVFGVCDGVRWARGCLVVVVRAVAKLPE